VTASVESFEKVNHFPQNLSNARNFDVGETTTTFIIILNQRAADI